MLKIAVLRQQQTKNDAFFAETVTQTNKKSNVNNLNKLRRHGHQLKTPKIIRKRSQHQHKPPLNKRQIIRLIYNA